MKLLIMSGPFWPQKGNNANLISKLIPYLNREHELRILAPMPEGGTLPQELDGVKIHWAKDERSALGRKLLWPAWSKIADPDGYSDAIASGIILSAAKKLRREYPFDAVISTMEPFPMGYAASKLPGVKKILYLMDPPDCVRGGEGTAFRNRALPEILAAYDGILTTPFIKQALADKGYDMGKIITVGFPMIEPHERRATDCDVAMDKGKINLLFCGWLCSGIRSPEYFLRTISQLDEGFCVWFMGRECDRLFERFNVETRAQFVALPNQPYQTAINAMADADVLVNIGNSVPVHMPSKTLEYINTGKPMVNFYKMDDCPTLHYTSRYPLCLNIREGGDAAADGKRLREFCAENKGKTLDRTQFVSQLSDCTPEYIAQQILNTLGDKKWMTRNL